MTGQAGPRRRAKGQNTPLTVSVVPKGACPAYPLVDVVARVVDARGPCPYGYRLGDEFRFHGDGAVAPSLCHVALNALRPFVALAQAGALPPQERACCPVWDHLLVFEFQRVEERREGITAA